MPQTTIALLAGLQSIPDELHEAAAVDGATAWQRFRTITLPQLRPVIVAITSLDFIWNFNSFGLVYVLTQGGPGHSTELPMLFAYNEAFKYGEFGYASALGDAMVARDRLLARLLPLGPAQGDDAMIVSSPPEARAEPRQYVRAGRATCSSSRSRCSGCSRSRSRGRGSSSSCTRADPAAADARELPRRAHRERARCTPRSTASRSRRATAIITTLVALPAAYVLARQRGADLEGAGSAGSCSARCSR